MMDDGDPTPKVVGIPFIFCNINALYLDHESLHGVTPLVYLKLTILGEVMFVDPYEA